MSRTVLPKDNFNYIFLVFRSTQNLLPISFFLLPFRFMCDRSEWLLLVVLCDMHKRVTMGSPLAKNRKDSENMTTAGDQSQRNYHENYKCARTWIVVAARRRPHVGRWHHTNCTLAGATHSRIEMNGWEPKQNKEWEKKTQRTHLII